MHYLVLFAGSTYLQTLPRPTTPAKGRKGWVGVVNKAGRRNLIQERNREKNREREKKIEREHRYSRKTGPAGSPVGRRVEEVEVEDTLQDAGTQAVGSPDTHPGG